jgi:hypothetical protein
MRLSRLVLAAGLSSLATPALLACGSGDATTTTTSTTGSGAAGGAGSTSATTGQTGGAGGGATTGSGPSDIYPAPHPEAPQVTSPGGPVIATPKLVPVFFAGDDPAIVTALTDFADEVGATAYWTATTSEYGVGPAVSLGAVQLTDTAPAMIDDATIQTWLAGKLEQSPSDLPAAASDNVYVLYYPAGTTISLGGGGGGAQLSCQAFGGYHGDFQLDAAHNNQHVSYAVVPRCASFGNLSGIDALTGTSSHEIIEAVTDPLPTSTPAFDQVDTPHLYWERVLGGGETGDMCAQFPDAFTKFAELAYTVQRTWSNKAAAQGGDPCVPTIPGKVYFNAAPVLSDDVSTTFFGQPVKMKGVNIPVGSSKAIDVDLFSTADTGAPFTVSAVDFASALGQPAHLAFSFDKTQGKNGEVLHLTIQVNSTGKNKTASFLLKSTLGAEEHLWIGLVGSP